VTARVPVTPDAPSPSDGSRCLPKPNPRPPPDPLELCGCSPDAEGALLTMTSFFTAALPRPRPPSRVGQPCGPARMTHGSAIRALPGQASGRVGTLRSLAVGRHHADGARHGVKRFDTVSHCPLLIQSCDGMDAFQRGTRAGRVRGVQGRHPRRVLVPRWRVLPLVWCAADERHGRAPRGPRAPTRALANARAARPRSPGPSDHTSAFFDHTPLLAIKRLFLNLVPLIRLTGELSGRS
jgi:hypothetical protein